MAYSILLYTQFLSAFIIFIVLLFVSAPYGRHIRTGWGPAVSARAGWLLMELPAVVLIAWCFYRGDRPGNIVAISFLALWELHYLQRTFIFPLQMRTNRRFPVILVIFALLFNIMNGYINGIYLFTLSVPLSVTWLRDPRFLIGTALFVGGLAVNIHSDRVLRNLRAPGETGYKIPTAGLFRFISCPNYFGEILEWTGWALATWSPPGLAFALFTIANLAPRARAHHGWYRKTFPDYPSERKRVIPFIY